MTNNQARLPYIDAIKSIAIFLIVLGHNNYDSKAIIFFNSFSLPVFFIISGFLQGSPHSCFLGFAKKRAERLLIPYLFFSSFLYMFWIFVGKNVGSSATHHYSATKNFIGIFYAQGGAEYMDWGIPLWFLPALFMLSIVAYGISKLPVYIQILTVLLFIPCGNWLFINLGFHLPWSFDVVMVSIGFYFVGMLVRRYEWLNTINQKPTIYIIAACSLAFHLFLFESNGYLSIYYGHYGNIALMYLNGLLGSFWLYVFIKPLNENIVLSWIGKNTLPILALHMLAMTFIKGLLIFVLKTEIDTSFTAAFIYSFIQIIILIPPIILLNRYFPVVVGAPSKKYSQTN